MYRRCASSAVVAALLVTAAACDGGTVGPDSARLTDAELRAMASEFEGIGTGVADGRTGLLVAALGRIGPGMFRPEFDVTRACPAGGTVTVAGQTVRDGSPESRTFTVRTTATKTHLNCAWETRRGVVVTTNGNPNLVLTAQRNVVAGVPTGPQTHTQKGSFTWSASDGRSGTCPVDISATWVPQTRTHTVTGVFCDRRIDVTRRGPG
jgi:hypothetical protein